MISSSLARYGTVSAETEDRVFKTGPLEVRLQGCDIQSVWFRGRQMLGSLAFLVRDRGWGTVPVDFEQLAHETKAQGFSLSFACSARSSDIDLSWETQIDASADGVLTLAVRCRPNAPTTTNRAGLVVLHPTQWAGARAEIRHPDGTQTVGVLPHDVDPEPCFSDIAALRIEQPDAWVDLRFAGGSWEMEDQRNWLDASFKTYFRPLSLPYPYDIPAEFFQSVTASFGCEEAAAASVSSSPLIIDTTRLSPVTAPRLGLRSDGRYSADELTNSAALADLKPSALHASLDLRSPAWPRRLAEVTALSARMTAPVCLEVIPDLRAASVGVFAELAAALDDEADLAVESLLVSLPEDKIRLEPGPPAPPQALLLDIHRQARRAFPGLTIGGGTLGFFAELNRNWPPTDLVDFVAHASSSIVHAADTATLTENIASYAPISATVRAAYGALPHRWISATIGVLDNPYNPPSQSPWSSRPAPLREFDPRHGALFGAAWTLASFAVLARAGAAEVVPACLCGPAGVLSSKLDAPQPWYDAQQGSRLYPLYHVLRGLSRLSGSPSLAVETSAVHAIGRAMPDRSCELWLANLSGQSVAIDIKGATNFRVATLDEVSFEQASVAPDFMDSTEPRDTPRLELRPYAIHHVTFEETLR